MTLRHKMSAVDTAWLRMDRPSNLMMIVGVLMFEGRVDYDRMKATIVARIAPFDRFRQTVAVDESGAWWVDLPPWCDVLDFDYHLQRAQLPGDAGKEALEAYAAARVSEPLDSSRPLWQMTLIDNYQGGTALVVRIHHCIADGIALVGVMLKLTDQSPDAEHELASDLAPTQSSATKSVDHTSTDDSPQSDDDETDFWKQLIAPITAAAIRTIGVSGVAISRSLELIAQPEKATHYAKIAGAVANEVARLVAMPDDSATRFKGKPARAKTVAWSEPMPLDIVKATGRVLGGSVNDVVLSCVAGALRGYLIDSGDDPDGVAIRAMIPVNLRRPQPSANDGSAAAGSAASQRATRAGALGNRFGLVALSLPLGIANPIARLAEVRARMAALKGSYQAPVTLGVLGLVGMAPKVVQTQVLDLLSKKATAVMTNVPGPQLPLYMAGARLDQMMFWVPQSGDIGMGVSILSYNGGVQFGLVCDAVLVPDPVAIVERFEPEFQRLLLAVMMSPRDAATIDADAAESAIFGT